MTTGPTCNANGCNKDVCVPNCAFGLDVEQAVSSAALQHKPANKQRDSNVVQVTEGDSFTNSWRADLQTELDNNIRSEETVFFSVFRFSKSGWNN